MAKKTKEDIDKLRLWLEQGVDVDNRKIMLDETIDADSVGWVIRAIHKMEAESKTEPIHVYVSSYGGDVYDGLSLYDLMIASACPIYTYGQGKVMSMATIIMLGGSQRYAYKNATFMFHSLSDWVEIDKGTKIFESEIDLKESQRLEKRCNEIYVNRTGYEDTKFWKRWLKHEDKYLDTKQAVDIGFITHEI